MSESQGVFDGETFVFSNTDFDYPPTIEPDGTNGEDFILRGGHAWISVGNLSIRINNEILKTKVGIWERGKEDEDPLDSIQIYQPDNEDEV